MQHCGMAKSFFEQEHNTYFTPQLHNSRGICHNIIACTRTHTYNIVPIVTPAYAGLMKNMSTRQLRAPRAATMRNTIMDVTRIVNRGQGTHEAYMCSEHTPEKWACERNERFL